MTNRDATNGFTWEGELAGQRAALGGDTLEEHLAKRDDLTDDEKAKMLRKNEQNRKAYKRAERLLAEEPAFAAVAHQNIEETK